MTELAELQRRAYARESTAEERAAAERELAALRASMDARREIEALHASLAATQPIDTEPAQFGIPEHWSVPHPHPAALWMLAALSLAGAVASSVLPARPSLEVFDRPATAADRGGPEWLGRTSIGEVSAGPMRWLGADRGWNIYGILTDDDRVCLWVADPTSGNGGCTSLTAFETGGLGIGAKRADEPEYLTVFWGPTGDARLYELPIEEVLRSGLESLPRAPAG